MSEGLKLGPCLQLLCRNHCRPQHSACPLNSYTHGLLRCDCVCVCGVCVCVLGRASIPPAPTSCCACMHAALRPAHSLRLGVALTPTARCCDCVGGLWLSPSAPTPCCACIPRLSSVLPPRRVQVALELIGALTMLVCGGRERAVPSNYTMLCMHTHLVPDLSTLICCTLTVPSNRAQTLAAPAPSLASRECCPPAAC